MGKVMHIADDVTAALHDRGLLTGWALCGKCLTPQNGASPNAPVCPKCQR